MIYALKEKMATITFPEQQLPCLQGLGDADCILSWVVKPFGRIHWLHHCRGLRSSSQPSVLDVTLNNLGEVLVMLELWVMWSTPSLPSLPGSLGHGVVAPNRVLSMGQIELNCVLMLNWIVWNIILAFNCVDKNYIFTKLNCLI